MQLHFIRKLVTLSLDLELMTLSKREASEKYYKIKSLKGKFNFTDHYRILAFNLYNARDPFMNLKTINLIK